MKKYLLIAVIALLALVSTARAQGYSFYQNLTLGSRGADVVALQTWLIANGYNIPSVSSGIALKGFFGAQTKTALMQFQSFAGIPNTGYFGPMTRASIMSRSPIPVGGGPVINGVDAPTALVPLQVGIWTVRATDPQNSGLSYSVDWGDVAICPSGYTCTAPGITPQASVQQTATFTHSFVNAGTYIVKFTVRNSAGLTAQSSIIVVVGSNVGAGPLSITSPNGGESWQRGTTQTIRWTSPAYFRATYADLKLVPYYAPCTTQICPMAAQTTLAYPYLAPYTIATNININQNSYVWNVQTVVNPNDCPSGYACQPTVFNDGQYTIQICESGTNNCDSSDRLFTIFSSSLNPQVVSPNGGEVWAANSTQRLSWSNLGMNSTLDLYLDQTNIYCITTPYGASYTLDRNISVSNVYNWIVATDVNNYSIPAGDYKFRVCLAGTTVNCDSGDRAFTITR